MRRDLVIFLVASLFGSGCATVGKPHLTVEAGDASALFGAAAYALVSLGYEFQQDDNDVITTKERVAGSRGEVQWDIVLRPQGSGLLIDTNSVGADGKVNKHVAKYMKIVEGHIGRALREKPVDQLKRLAARINDFTTIYYAKKEDVGDHCKNLESVNVGVPGASLASRADTLAAIFKANAAMLGGNRVIMERTITGAIDWPGSERAQGTVYQCEETTPESDLPADEEPTREVVQEIE